MFQPSDSLPVSQLYERYRDFELVVDSRLVGQADTSLFFALAGERRDGHGFIAHLIGLGVRNFVVASAQYGQYLNEIREAEELVVNGSGPEPVNLVVVEYPMHVLQQLAAHHRRQFDIPVVAITGSNGKTIVKDWLVQLLSAEFGVCGSPRSYNSLIGVPLSVWQLKKSHEMAVFEVGISQPGDMDTLWGIIRPTCGVLTTIGTAHLSNFASVGELIQEKLRLFQGADWVLLPETLKSLTSAIESLPSPAKVYTWSGNGRTGLRVDNLHLELSFPELPDVYLDNARSAAAAARMLHLELRYLTAGVSRLLPLKNRLEQRTGRDGGPIINDSYSNDFSALAAALEFAENQDPFGCLTLILGTVQPIPGLATKLATLLKGRVDRLLLVGPANEKLRLDFPGKRLYPSVDALTRDLHTLSFHGETVLIKGASYEHFDQIADLLSRQLHRTTLEVNLAAIRQNLRLYRQQLPPSCKLVVMAKASAYGSGALPVAQLLQDAGVDYLAVAYPEEGKELRSGGITLPIMVLNAEAYSYPLLVDYRLEPVVHQPEQLRLATSLHLPVHIELDTGMGRLGFLPSEFRQLVIPPADEVGQAFVSLFTHLAASEDPGHDAFTRQQLAQFDHAYDDYLARAGSPVLRHALNTNGISRFPQAAYDMVRLGIGLYGIGDEGLKLHLQPVLTLTTTVTSITTRPAGATVGYGRLGRIGEESRIAVLSIGYADGLPRSAGGGRFAVRINGHLAPTIGAICMDMCMVDVTYLPEIQVGDHAIIFGPDHPVELLASAAKTIPYEILTGIGQRVHRIYLGE